MASETAKSTVPGLLSAPRIITLLGSVLVALSSGTNYVEHLAYAPQLGARLHVSHTQLNVIGLAGNVGVYSSGPVWGRIVDLRGPRIPLIGASICLLLGYSGIKRIYDDGVGGGTTVSALHFAVLVMCGFMTGLGGNAGLGAAVNTTAKSFPDTARATTTGLVLSGFGLSAFWFSMLAHLLFPGDTSAFLLILALGTAIPMLVGLFIVRPIPLPPSSSSARHDVTDGRGRGEGKDGLPNIYGKQLWLTPDFYLIFTIMGICSGTGIMYINNVGSISQALYAKANPIYDDLEASKWQAAQVSTVSIGNFAGRILIGLISDFTRNRLHLPRAYCLCIVSSLFIVSQAFAIGITSVQSLWMASALLGLAYGSLFGICPTIVIEWFGLAHLSENWGYASLAPLVGGNLFSLMFGRNLDAHAPNQDTRGSLSTRCFDGRGCYVSSLEVTIVACFVALGLSVWAGIRDGRKGKGKNARRVRGEE
ncbi:hypothetical protein HYDPIDRAFT_101889 [Hydnomerulius pinastri MD-312]|uniref:Nodulin-like domain-containing protein n=1 Tax=Hydnomerulius pinastri MD-312 TaxID=994086 RepID=A0A0C9VMI1_9AGAM|nr:hypothetical protein HYDPIDRAFT_101889 [Hydnomerulius pinastri MD-312]